MMRHIGGFFSHFGQQQHILQGVEYPQAGQRGRQLIGKNKT